MVINIGRKLKQFMQQHKLADVYILRQHQAKKLRLFYALTIIKKW
jgi:hypothetical protein